MNMTFLIVSRLPFHFLLFSSLLFLSQNHTTAEDPTFMTCPSSPIYTSGSRFETNLNSLLLLLNPNRSIDLNGYTNATSGSYPDVVYGFSQCMSGVSEDGCRKCLQNSTLEAKRICPTRKQATVRYENCLLRYSYQPFFSQVDDSIWVTGRSIRNVSDPTVFHRRLGELMKNLTAVAASRPSKFSEGMANLTNVENVSGEVECTRDLSDRDCISCLQAMVKEIPECCSGKEFGEVYSFSCSIRYEIVDLTMQPASLPPPQLNSDSDVTNGNSNKKNRIKGALIMVFLSWIAWLSLKV